MATIHGWPDVGLRLTLQITEGEARALDAMAGYGADAFIKTFYEKLGKAYMQEHEKSLRMFLEDVRRLIPPLLARADAARHAFTGVDKVVRAAADMSAAALEAGATSEKKNT